MATLVIWNNSSYLPALVAVFGDEHVVFSADRLQGFLEAPARYDSILVLCELDWSLAGTPFTAQQFYGIDLVKQLRSIYGLPVPVMFVSFCSLKTILNPEREIITAIGHAFVRLPARPADLLGAIEEKFMRQGETRRLSVMELNDIRSFYCDKEGILSHELHALNRFLNTGIDEDNRAVIHLEIEESIRKIHALFLTDPASAIQEFNEEFPVLSKENMARALEYITGMGNLLRNNFGEKTASLPGDTNQRKNYPWKILLLDDEINAQHGLIDCFRRNGVSVICCNNAAMAFSILQDDWAKANNIMVVIADYRLYEEKDGVRYHQEIQGYQFLKEIAGSDQLVRLVAFSGLQRKFLLNSFKHYNVRTEVKSKIDYLANDRSHQFFCEEIIELAEENAGAMEAMPSQCAGFEKYLSAAYREFRRHPDYSRLEGNISAMAGDYVRQIKQQLEDGQEITIGGIDNIKSPLAKTKKDEEAYLKRLQNYFVARRVVFWLYAYSKKQRVYSLDSRKMAEIVTGNTYSTDAYRQIISTNLGISLDDFPRNITIEERRWLQYDMDMHIFRDIDRVGASFGKIERYFQDFIMKSPELTALIRENNHRVSLPYRNTVHAIIFDKELKPVLRTATDLRVVYLIIAGHINSVNQ